MGVSLEEDTTQRGAEAGVDRWSPPGLARSEQTRARLLDASEYIFGTRGYHDASISDITQRAGVAQGTFYVYFPSKLEAFQSLVRDRMAELRQDVAFAIAEATTPTERAVAGARASFDWVSRHPHIYRVARGAEFVDKNLLNDFYRILADEYRRILARQMDDGELPPADPEVLAWALMGMGDFVSMRYIVWQPDGTAIPDPVFDAFVDLVLRTLGLPRE